MLGICMNGHLDGHSIAIMSFEVADHVKLNC